MQIAANFGDIPGCSAICIPGKQVNTVGKGRVEGEILEIYLVDCLENTRVAVSCPRMLVNLQKVGCVVSHLMCNAMQKKKKKKKSLTAYIYFSKSDPILKLLGLDTGLDFDSQTNSRSVNQ